MTQIISPQFSFVQFNSTDLFGSCEFEPVRMCLPIYGYNECNFQFILKTDTEGEADVLCDKTNDLLEIGIVNTCDEDFILPFVLKTERFRISPTQVLYNWTHGLPGFDTVISIGECFRIKIILTDIYETTEWCSNCFQRIGDPCHTSVLEYTNEDNSFSFDYCGGSAIDDSAGQTCEPTFIQFTNQTFLAIPYTAQLANRYGLVPSVSVWIYSGTELVEAGLLITFDAFPPTLISVDLGGSASGVLKLT